MSGKSTDIDLSKYTGTPRHCCLIMDMAMDEDYVFPTISLFSSQQYPPHIAGPKLSKSGQRHKPDLLINYCPFCGKKLIDDEPQTEEHEAVQP